MSRVNVIAAYACTIAATAVLFSGIAHAQEVNAPVIYAEPTFQPVLKSTIDDMPTAANPHPKTDMSNRWVGGYAGIAVGYGMLWDSQDATANGADFGGYAGYNIRIKGSIIGGLEGEYMHINREFSDNIGVIANETFTAKARLGYEHGRFLAYGLVGAQHATSQVPFPWVPGNRSVDTTLVLGAGFDVAVTDKISLGAEYTRAYYHDFDRETLFFPLDVSVQRVNARMTYKIN